MTPLRILLTGGYRNRNPLAYAPIRAALGDRVELVDHPEAAQILLISHVRDIKLFGASLAETLRQSPPLRLVLLSEEPFWDSCWMVDPFTRHQRFSTPAGQVDCTVLNHMTSDIFRAAQFPYFLLTDRSYIERYRPLFERNAGWSARDWQRHFADVPLDAVFLAERRTEARFAPDFGTDALRGLSVWRSRLAEQCQGAAVIREGVGWSEGPRRQDLPDWHADKLARFDLRSRYMSALENTHQADYLSEKLWDAFAMGAVPLYLAGPGHAAHRLVGAGGWINLHAALPAVPDFDAHQPVDAAGAGAYAARQDSLARLFADRAGLAAEYERLCTALLQALAEALQGTAPAPRASRSAEG